MATATTSVDNSLPAKSASESVEGRSNVSPMKYFTEKVYEPMQQCIASGSFSISSKKALLPVESASDSLEGTNSVSPTDSST